jgi:sugar (pentulose or hexulose) kinase
VGAQIAADALNVPVATVTSVGEGGAYGAALLAAYTEYSTVSLSDFLSDKVFNNVSEYLYTPKNTDDFNKYLSRFKDGLKNLI